MFRFTVQKYLWDSIKSLPSSVSAQMIKIEPSKAFSARHTSKAKRYKAMNKGNSSYLFSVCMSMLTGCLKLYNKHD